MSRRLPSTSPLIHYSLIILSFDAVYSELLTDITTNKYFILKDLKARYDLSRKPYWSEVFHAQRDLRRNDFGSQHMLKIKCSYVVAITWRSASLSDDDLRNVLDTVHTPWEHQTIHNILVRLGIKNVIFIICSIYKIFSTNSNNWSVTIAFAILLQNDTFQPLPSAPNINISYSPENKTVPTCTLVFIL